MNILNHLRKPKAIWLASYPRSGNRWLRSLIAYIMTSGSFISSPQDKVDQFIPDIHKGHLPRSILKSSFPVIKTHWLPQSSQTKDFKALSAVYLYRSPTDVLVSSYKHLINTGELDGAELTNLQESRKFQEFAEQFIKNRGYWGWLQTYGSWETHIDSWMFKKQQFPVLPVSYEALQQTPLTTLKTVTNFLGLNAADSLIEDAISAYEFANAKAREPDNVTLAVGRTGYAYQLLSSDNKQSLQTQFGVKMRGLSLEPGEA